MRDLWLILRYGMRTYVKSLSFTIIALLTLALGIGANAAIFTVLDAVLIRPLPYPTPGQLVMMWESNPKRGLERTPIVEGVFPFFQQASQSFEEMAAFAPPLPPGPQRPQTTVWNTSEPLVQVPCTASLFQILGARPVLGRTFLPADEKWGAMRVIILSYRLWQELYKKDPNVIGKTLALNRLGVKFDYTIVGVMPRFFVFPYPLFREKADSWEAWRYPPGGPTGARALWVLGRLKPSVTLSEANAEVQTIANRIAAEYPGPYAGERMTLAPLAQEVVSGVDTILLVLFGAVGFLLLIACANVGNMLLARGVHRQREMAIRIGLGASRIALLRQMLIESAMLGVAGGAVGTLLATWILKVYVELVPPDLYVPRLNEVVIDVHVLSYVLVASVASAVIFGLLPALQISRPDVCATLKSGIAARKCRRTSLFRQPGSILVVSEIALALVLLTGSLLLIRSLRQLLTVNLNFQPQRLLALDFMLSNGAEIGPNQEVSSYDQFLQTAGRLPGVRSVALAGSFPLGNSLRQFKALGADSPIFESFVPAEAQYVTPNFFDMMGMILDSGRAFDSTDRIGTTQVVIINETMEKRYWPRTKPLGDRIEMGPEQAKSPVYYEIVGIVHESKRFGAGHDAPPTVYFPILQNPSRGYTILVRTGGDPRSIVDAMRGAAEAIVPGETLVFGVRTGDEIIANSTARLKFAAVQLGTFAGIAAMLAALGVFGLMSYSTTQRTPEIGLRIALGAQPGDVLWDVVGQGTKLAVAGVAIGICGALALTRLLQGLLYGVRATDMITFTGVAILLMLVALVASYIPARRVMQIDPAVALRHE